MTQQQHEPVTVPTWTVTDRLRKAREAAGLQQVELADRIGVSRGCVSGYERGSGNRRKIVMRAWALATGVPLEWIETGKAPTRGPSDGEGTVIRCSSWPSRGPLSSQVSVLSPVA